jgi:hypothetical protein
VGQGRHAVSTDVVARSLLSVCWRNAANSCQRSIVADDLTNGIFGVLARQVDKLDRLTRYRTSPGTNRLTRSQHQAA